MKNNINDDELIYLVREIGEEFREVILKKYESLVNLIAFQKFKRQGSMGVDLEDYVQEGFIGLNNAINHYDIDSKATFYTYASICINRKIHISMRKYYRAKEITDYRYYEPEDSSYVIAEDCEYYAINTYYYERLIRLIHKFHFDYACVFEMKYNGFSYKEISKLLGFTMKQVDRYLYEFRNFLKMKNYNRLNLE